MKLPVFKTPYICNMGVQFTMFGVQSLGCVQKEFAPLGSDSPVIPKLQNIEDVQHVFSLFYILNILEFRHNMANVVQCRVDCKKQHVNMYTCTRICICTCTYTYTGICICISSKNPRIEGCPFD